MRSARPNAAHLGLAQLPVAGIVTQNVDGLHQAAAREEGSRSPVIDLHGSLDRVICLKEGHMFDRDWVQIQLSELNPEFAKLVGIDPIDVETAPTVTWIWRRRRISLSPTAPLRWNPQTRCRVLR